MWLFVCKIRTYPCDFACVPYSIKVGVGKNNNSSCCYYLNIIYCIQYILIFFKKASYLQFQPTIIPDFSDSTERGRTDFF